MPNYHLAQINIARFKVPLDDPSVADFFDYLAPVNALADVARGFVWRFQTSEGDATGLRVVGDDRVLVNFSVWESVEALRKYVYNGSHADVMRMRRKWFEKIAEPFLAMWWLPAGEVPTWEEAQARLKYLGIHGESPYVFTFRQLFSPQDLPITKFPPREPQN